MVVERKVRPGIRCGLNSPFYFRICKENYEKFQKYEIKLSPLAKEPDFDVYQSNPNKDKQNKCRTIVVVFASMCLEAFIYDYAAYNLGDSFVRDHLDRLKLESKWAVAVQLTTGKQFPRGSNAFKLLKNLRKVRNSLVHSKSKLLSLKVRDVHQCSSSVGRYRELLKKAKKRDDQMLIDTHEAYKAIKEALVQLDKLDTSDFKKQELWRFFERKLLSKA